MDNLSGPVDKLRLKTGLTPIGVSFAVRVGYLPAKTTAVQKGYILWQPSPFALQDSLLKLCSFSKRATGIHIGLFQACKCPKAVEAVCWQGVRSGGCGLA